MEHHTHLKRRSKKKFLLIFLFLIFIIFGAKYLYTRSSLKGDDVKPTATSTPSTPVVSKPKPRDKPYISVTPSEVWQGEPAIITAEGIATTSSVKSFTFNNRPLIKFLYKGQLTGFLGVDLYSVTGTFPIVVTFDDGKELRGEIVIKKRAEIREPFDIPEKLGGNTQESVKTLISTLASEGKIINAIFTSEQMFWKEKFRYPLNNPIVVADPYGYTRAIGNFTMPHKGVDLEASIGTPVYAMNRGVVRFTGSLRNYGNTIVIDHGLGIQTVYMHLSEIVTGKDKMVEKGELIAKSGDTGYTLNPHLHLTVRIWDVSIDPIKFLELFGEGS